MREHAPATGFTLLELMITVVIVAILASVAVPSYMAHIQSTRREEAKKALLDAAQKMESFYAQNMKYDGATDNNGDSTIFKKQVPDTGTAHYLIKIDSADKYTYTLKAVRNGVQANDPCGDLVLKRDGTQDVSDDATYSKAQCW